MFSPMMAKSLYQIAAMNGQYFTVTSEQKGHPAMNEMSAAPNVFQRRRHAIVETIRFSASCIVEASTG